jgi:hypothetical protein
MSRVERIRIAIGFTATALLSSVPSALAAEANSPKVCKTLIERTGKGGGDSRVVSTECSRDAASLRTPGDTLIVTFYEDASYLGDQEFVYTSAPCDNEGWVMPELEDLNDRINGVSSYIYGNDCNTQVYYYEEDFEGARKSWRHDNPWIGSEWDNHLYSMRMWWEA